MKKLINFLISDFKQDVEFFKKGCPIKKEVKDNFHYFLKGDFWIEVLKEYWLFFLLLIASFLAGMFIAYIFAFMQYEAIIINEILPNCTLWQQLYDYPGKPSWLYNNSFILDNLTTENKIIIT